MAKKVYTFTLSAPHHAIEGEWWGEMIGNFEIVEVLSETAFLAVRIGRVRVMWLRFKKWITRTIGGLHHG